MPDHNTDDELPVLEVSDSVSVNGGSLNLLDESYSRLQAQQLVCLEKYFSLLTKAISFKEFCRELMFAMMGVLPCEAASLLEVDSNREFLFFRTSAGRCSDKIQDFRVPVGQGVAGSVVISKTYTLVDRASENQIHLKSIGDAVGFKANNLLAVPLLIRGEVFGVFELLNRLDDHGFSADDVALALKTSEWMAKAIEIRMMINFCRTSNEGNLKAA